MRSNMPEVHEPIDDEVATNPNDWDSGSLKSPLGKSATMMLIYLALLWIIDVVNNANDRSWNLDLGIAGRNPDRLVGILVAPFLHGDVAHLMANASAVFTLGLIAGLYGVRRFLGVVAVIILVGGFGLWLIAPADSVTVGASGVVFGLFGYLLTRGLFDRRPVDVVVSLGVAIAFGYTILAGVLPQDGRISWQGHLAGFFSGILAAWLFRYRKRKSKKAAQDDPMSTAPSPMDDNPTDALPLPSTERR